LPKLRILVVFALGLIACTVLVSSPTMEWTAAHAQAKKKPGKKAPAAKDAAKDQQERPPFTLADEEAAIIPGIADARVWGDSEKAFASLLPQTSGPWLAVSGGGSDGAFGGGVLTGWTESGNRPEFAAVTGSSIGSLIAPYAFLGPSYDEVVRRNFTTISAADVFEDRMSRDSLFDYWPLRRQIEQNVTEKLLADIAAQHARGRRLFVATTNLDAGRRVVWNMGAIAARGDDKAMKLFRQILLASCSIPGLFSPVAIEVEANGKAFQEMHGDGTLTAPFFVVPETMLAASSTTRPPLSELYVIINSKLGPEFSMPSRSIASVLGRAIAVALTQALRSQLMLVYAGTQRHGIALRVAHVDAAFNHPARGPFDSKYMQALYALGVAAGKSGTAFEEAVPALILRGAHDAK
jgi:Patatin-like phospholipase